MALKCFVFQFEILRYEFQCLDKIISIKPGHDGCKIRSFLFSFGIWFVKHAAKMWFDKALHKGV